MDGCRRRLGLRRNSGVVAVLACRAAAFAKAASALTIWAVQKELPRIKNLIDREFVEPTSLSCRAKSRHLLLLSVKLSAVL